MTNLCLRQLYRELAVNRDELAQAIIDLENGQFGPLEDEQLAYDLGQHLKPLIDHQVVEVTSGSSHPDQEPAGPPDDELRPRERSVRTPAHFDGPIPELANLSDRERARWIFMERFITLEQLEKINGCAFSQQESDQYNKALDEFLGRLFMLKDVASAMEAYDLPALQQMFSSTLILMRHKEVGDGGKGRVPCTLENLRLRFDRYFYKRRSVPNWYESQPFYAEPLGKSQWVLCEIDYLNCTLRNPKKRISTYARAWSLSSGAVLQKNVLEDVYDRIICGEALREHPFEQNCNSCTTTSYAKGTGLPYSVYTVQKDQKIAIHGKLGLPHWRTTRRLWPGVYPTLIP